MRLHFGVRRGLQNESQPPGRSDGQVQVLQSWKLLETSDFGNGGCMGKGPKNTYNDVWYDSSI